MNDIIKTFDDWFNTLTSEAQDTLVAYVIKNKAKNLNEGFFTGSASNIEKGFNSGPASPQTSKKCSSCGKPI